MDNTPLENGLKAWRRLVHKFDPVSAHANLMSKVLKHPQGRVENIAFPVNTWEDVVRGWDKTNRRHQTGHHDGPGRIRPARFTVRRGLPTFIVLGGFGAWPGCCRISQHGALRSGTTFRTPYYVISLRLRRCLCTECALCPRHVSHSNDLLCVAPVHFSAGRARITCSPCVPYYEKRCLMYTSDFPNSLWFAIVLTHGGTHWNHLVSDKLEVHRLPVFTERRLKSCVVVRRCRYAWAQHVSAPCR